MPRCYLLAVCGGSSLDQHSNNITLFNLVEQIQVRPGAPPPNNRLIPLEIHAYYEFAPGELNKSFDVRFALVAEFGLETFTNVYTHRPVAPRLRTRTLGLPFPPVSGRYTLRVDMREAGTQGWIRDGCGWPVSFTEAEVRPRTTH